LLGVIASAAGKGAALISVDGEPPRPLAVGAQVAPGYTLKAVGRREAWLADSASVPAQIKLSLPALEDFTDSEQPPAAAAAVAVPARPAVIVPAPSAANPPAVPGPSRATRPGEGPPARQDSRYPSQGR
jgi:general secretion pathway protein C